jgi:hypothetical protein
MDSSHPAALSMERVLLEAPPLRPFAIGIDTSLAGKDVEGFIERIAEERGLLMWTRRDAVIA